MKASNKLAVAALVAAAFAVADAQSGKQVMAISVPTADHGWTGGIVFHARRAETDLEKKYPNLDVIVKLAKDPTEQASQIQDLLTVNKMNALVILPHESAPLTQPVKRIHDQKVWVTVVDRGLTDTTAQDAYVAGDNPGMGRVSGEFVCQEMKNTGNLVILRGLPVVIDDERVNAFEAVMKAKCPNVKILDKKHANWNRDDGFKVMQDFLTRFPKIDAVWAQDDDIAVGVMKAIDQAKRTDIKLVLGGAGSKEYIKKVMDGDKLVRADVTYSPTMIYDAAVLTADQLVGGKKMPAKTIIPSVLVTKTNATKYYFPTSPF
jgi:ribose transport system substrate-binding protein